MQFAEPANHEQELHHDAAIVRHERRPQWGAAIMLWERDGKRGYRFEDGAERTFKVEYCSMFEPCSTEDSIATALMQARDSEGKTDESKPRGRARSKDVPTLVEQAMLFRRSFPEGFVDSTFVRKHRGGSGRRVKRHRAPAITEAKTQLAKEALDERIAAGDYAAVIRRAHDVLANTDLVTVSQLTPLKTARPSSALAQALRDYLHETDPDGARFDELLRRLGRNSKGRVSWPLMTALRALVNPDDDVCVRPSVFQAQATLLSPPLAKRQRPTGATYNRWRDLAEDLRARLAGVGLEVTDLWDLYDFVWLTLRPAALKQYPALRSEEASANDTAAAPAAEADTEAA